MAATVGCKQNRTLRRVLSYAFNLGSRSKCSGRCCLLPPGTKASLSVALGYCAH